MSLIDTHELQLNSDNFKIIDCSWHMPQANRDGYEEYKQKHIPNSIFFDLDKNSKKDTDLPHMLVNSEEWREIVSKMGIENDDQIVIYDNSNVISSCRCWFNFIYFGHRPELVKGRESGGAEVYVSAHHRGRGADHPDSFLGILARVPPFQGKAGDVSGCQNPFGGIVPPSLHRLVVGRPILAGRWVRRNQKKRREKAFQKSGFEGNGRHGSQGILRFRRMESPLLPGHAQS